MKAWHDLLASRSLLQHTTALVCNILLLALSYKGESCTDTPIPDVLDLDESGSAS